MNRSPTVYSSLFHTVADLVLVAEGVFSDDTCLGDTGGATKYGHDTASWPEALARMPDEPRSRMPTNVCDLTRDLAVEAYWWAYWIYYRCYSYGPAFSLLTFDARVNGGDADRWMQHAVGVSADGKVGPVTMAAVRRARTPAEVTAIVAEFQSWHLAYLAGLREWPEFGAHDRKPLGWSRRLFTMALAAASLGAAGEVYGLVGAGA